jgi:hypothetical protein
MVTVLLPAADSCRGEPLLEIITDFGKAFGEAGIET